VVNVTSTIFWDITLIDALEDIGKAKPEQGAKVKPTKDCSFNIYTPAKQCHVPHITFIFVQMPM
jgi:hypothetical protein